MSEITEWELLRLVDCQMSTRLGIIDQGFPMVMRKLAAKNLVEPVGSGHRITEEGNLYLSAHFKDVYMCSHTIDKWKPKREWISYEDDDDEYY